MIDEKFKEIMRSNTGCAVIMAGSGSDEEHIGKIVKSLDKYEIPYTTRICSAHKQPDTLIELVNEFKSVGGLYAYIAVAGGTDALSGTVSFHDGPVISCPPDSPNESCLTNPPESANVHIRRAGNVGKFIAQMYKGVNPRFMELLEQGNKSKIESLQKADGEMQAKYTNLGGK